MSQTCTLHILHTNDLHSHFENMPQIATCLKEKRRLWEVNNEHVLTVDIGDHTDRMQMKTEATWGQANVRVLNHSGYQYVTIGNNEGLTFPKKELDHLYDQAEFQVVAANFVDAKTQAIPRWAIPYDIYECDGIKIAILGVTVAFTTFYEQLGWEVKDPFPILLEYVRQLRPEVEIILVLSHLGYHADVQMAKEIDGIDVILGAHTHRLLTNGEKVNQTWIAQAGKFGEYIGHVRLEIDPKSRRITAGEVEVFSAKDFTKDFELEKVISQDQQTAFEILAQPIADLRWNLLIDWQQETPFGSFLAASIRHWTNAEVGLANGGLLLHALKQGEVTRKDLLTCLPHPINPCLVELTGSQLLSVLQKAIQPSTVNKELIGFGFRGKKHGWLGVDNLQIQYRVEEERPVVTEVLVAGHPIDLDRSYKIGTVDMFMFNRLYPEFQEAPHHFFLPEVLREIIAEMITNEKVLEECFTKRWLLV